MTTMVHHQSKKSEQLEGKTAKRRRKNALFRARRIGSRSYSVKTSLAQGGRSLGEVRNGCGKRTVRFWPDD